MSDAKPLTDEGIDILRKDHERRVCTLVVPGRVLATIDALKAENKRLREALEKIKGGSFTVLTPCGTCKACEEADQTACAALEEVPK